MTLKSYDPDNNPDTKPPSLSLSEVAGEILDTGSHKFSEFYRNGGKVPGLASSFIDGVWVQGVNTFPDNVYGWIQHSIGISVQPDGITPTGNMFIYWNSILVYSVSNYGAVDFAKIFSPNQTGIDTDYEYRFSGGGGTLLGKLIIDIASTHVLYYAVDRRIKSSALANAISTSFNASVPEAKDKTISLSNFYGTSRIQSSSYTIPALDVTDFVSVSTNTAQPGGALSERISTSRVSFNQIYSAARITIPAFNVTLRGQYNSGSSGFFGINGSSATSSTIANAGVIVYNAAGVEVERKSVGGSSGNNDAVTVTVPQLQFDTISTGQFTVAFRADVANNGNSQHAWTSSDITLTVEART